jgi:hypothetical protein
VSTSSSFAINASNAVSASVATSASYALTASFALNAGGATVNTGSLLVTASAVSNIITFTKGDGSTFPVTVATGSTVSSSFASTASLALLNVLTASSNNATITYTKGDGTTFTNVINNVVNATSASFATSASQAISASQAQTAVSSSFATSASVATSASFATSASQAVSSSFAISASVATSASFATSASQATTASFAQNIASGLSPTFANVTASNVLITGTASVALLYTQTISSSVIYSSGSNQFGDASNDVQTLYGTFNVVNGPTNFTGSVNSVNGYTGSLAGTASFATSASQAVSSSFATTASFALNVTPTNTGSLLVTASAAGNVVTFTKGDGSTFPVTVDTGSAGVTIFTNATGSLNAIGYASQSFSNTSPGTPGATLFVSSSFIFSNNVSASSIRNAAIVGGKNHKAYDIIGGTWAVDSSAIVGGSDHEMKFSGSNNAIIGGQSNDLEAAGLNNSVILGGQNHRLYALDNSAIIGGSSWDARTASSRMVVLGGSGGTLDFFQDGLIGASNNINFQGGTLNNITVLSSKNVTKNAIGTDITSSVVLAAIDGTQSNRNFNKPYTTYSENFYAFNDITLQSGSLSGSAITNLGDIYPSSPAVKQIVTLTQAEYNAIGSPDANTLYIISGSAPFTTSGFATTGSNTFVGNQTISGSLTVTLGITGSLFGTASSAVFATGAGAANSATSASYALIATSASFATSASLAETASFYSLANVTQNAVFSGSVRGEVRALSISSQTASLDCSTDNFFTLTLVSGSTTFVNPSNILPGQTINLRIKQSSVASGSISFASSVKQVSGSLYTPTTTGSAEDIVTFISFDSTNLYLSNIKNFV